MTPDDRAFQSTRWSLVARAASDESAEEREALGELCRAYWWPLYAYLRKVGLNPEDSADTVQGLFTDLIEKRRFRQADQDRGRFRSWLLSALKYHLSHERERKATLKRGGGARVIELDPADAEQRWLRIDRREQAPDRLYERAWAIATLDRALRELEAVYARDGKAQLLVALKPALLHDPAAEDMRSIAAQCGMTATALKSATFRMRKALGQAIRDELLSTLDEHGDVKLEDELRALFAALASD